MARKSSKAPVNSRRVIASTQGPQIATRVLRQFRLVFNTVKTHFQQIEKHAGVGGSQVWALSVIRDNPGIGVNDLARSMDVRQPTASNLVKSLIAQELIHVRKDPNDGRAVRLHICTSGAKVLRMTPGPWSGILPEALAALDTETRCRLEKDLSTLINLLGADERAASTPLSEL